MTDFAFQQVDVFTSRPLSGNPLAVVIGADALTDAQMATFANWTNLSETTFLLQPTVPGADYRVRIFTSQRELPFDVHPINSRSRRRRCAATVRWSPTFWRGSPQGCTCRRTGSWRQTGSITARTGWRSCCVPALTCWRCVRT